MRVESLYSIMKILKIFLALVFTTAIANGLYKFEWKRAWAVEAPESGASMALEADDDAATMERFA